MTIGILFESKEWSTYALARHLAAMGAPAELFDLQEEINTDDILSCRLIVNRIFASAVFRGHQKALEQARTVIELIEESAVPMINPAEAHYYEISKDRSAKALKAQGFPVPKVYGVFSPKRMRGVVDAEGVYRADVKRAEGAECAGDAGNAGNAKLTGVKYPCVVKPDCGGRTNYTYIVNNFQELCESMENAPDIPFIAEEYIRPEYGFVTRLEIIDRSCKLAVKRGLAENGLSAYRLGSTYEMYYDLPGKIRDAGIEAMDALSIEAGSMDIIENESGFYIIDINSVSNASEDNTKMFRFDLMKETAAYIAGQYNLIL